MQYFALAHQQRARAARPTSRPAEMAGYDDFHARAASAIRAGDALAPAATAVRISGGPDAPVVTDGPFAEGAEVAGGYYVFEAENLDEALRLAREIPVAQYGAVEVWPCCTGTRPEPTGTDWLALLLEPADRQHARAAGMGGVPAACRVPRRGRRAHSRRGAAASAVDGDDGAGARRRGADHRRAVRRRRRGRQRLLSAAAPPTATRPPRSRR